MPYSSALDPFRNHSGVSIARKGRKIDATTVGLVPHDTNDFADGYQLLYVAVAGNLTFRTAHGNEIAITGAPVGVLPWLVAGVKTSGLTATLYTLEKNTF